MFEPVVSFIREMYGQDGFIPLHEPRFNPRDKELVSECIDSTFVSSVGKFVDQFEKMICEFTGSKYAVATVNGTASLHIALVLAGVEENDEVITQALTFVATANAISYQKAHPIFLDSGENNLGLCPKALRTYLEENTSIEDGVCVNKNTQRKIKACVPMHVFGHPVDIQEINQICREYNIVVIEDAAEALGSTIDDKHLGTLSPMGTLSFNGNKVITCGGGGMLLLQDEALAKKAKHLTTTAKIPHSWNFFHDEIGYNYRLPNLNAALGCAQMEKLESYINNKRETADLYQRFFQETPYKFIKEPNGSRSNYWLNALLLKDREERDQFLEETNKAEVMTRPVWELLTELPAFKGCERGPLTNARNYADRVVNIPSSVRI